MKIIKIWGRRRERLTRRRVKSVELEIDIEKTKVMERERDGGGDVGLEIMLRQGGVAGECVEHDPERNE